MAQRKIIKKQKLGHVANKNLYDPYCNTVFTLSTMDVYFTNLVIIQVAYVIVQFSLVLSLKIGYVP